MSARMSYESQQRGMIEIEFPIKHLNIQRERRLFQVETGPIMIPSETAGDWLSDEQGYFFNTAFVHFNRLNCAEITLNAPSYLDQETVFFLR
jgi:hypothetical protein